MGDQFTLSALRPHFPENDETVGIKNPPQPPAAPLPVPPPPAADAVDEASVTKRLDPAPEKQEAAEQPVKAPAETGSGTDPLEVGPAEAPKEKAPALSNEKVTEHTASLWKYLPIPSDEPEPAPEYLNCTVSFPGSTVIAARVRGKKHKHEGTNCDDWFETANYENITFIAVSDGAGSKRYSRIGARESCKSAIGFMKRAFEELLTSSPEIRDRIKLALSDPACMDSCRTLATLVQQAVVKAYEAVEAAFYTRSTEPAYAKALGRDLAFKDFAGTLLLAAIIPVSPETKENLIISCQIGDGMIFVLNSKGSFDSSLRLLGVPDSGEFSGETDFLTSPQMKSSETLQKRTKLYRGVCDTVMVMSDGVADDYFPNETQMRRLYYDLIINGVIDSGRPELDLSTLSKDDLRLFKQLPDPLTYPWVNDQNVKVTLQYTKRIMEATGATLESIWNDPRLLDLSMIELIEQEKTEDPSLRLRVWLDNYVERGSFDDRTLVIARI